MFVALCFRFSVGMLFLWLVCLGRTYGRVLDLSFGGRTENLHEIILESVPGADFYRTGPVSRGLGAKFGRKAAQNRNLNLDFSFRI